MDELETALKKAKTRKACGPDGIPAEFYKSLNEEGRQKLLTIFNSILASEDVPKDWGDSTTVLI
jgi:NADH:ubiquinone oxidoreductase subunit